MNSTNLKNRWAALAAGAALVTALAALLAAAQAPGFLKGRIETAGAASQPLAARLDEARRQAKGENYFTAYMFESRNRIHNHGDGRIVESYNIKTNGTKIQVRSKNERNENGISMDDDKNVPSPAGFLILWDGSKTGVLDVTVLDPLQTYEFTDAPVYWLGDAANDESMALVESVFAKVEGEHLKTSLVFLASCHTGPRGYAFVKKTASGAEAAKIRESAVFWLGNYGDTRSLADLKEIFGREKSASVRKQIVFAIQLNKSREATVELIAIAKGESDHEVRKSAVFWLGQKASNESVKALKDIVEAKDDSSNLKEQAVFAISQLPKDKSVPMLIDIAKTNGSPSLRKKAIFWLGQSGDEAALKLFEDILLKK
jgi:hypothetical protein